MVVHKPAYEVETPAKRGCMNWVKYLTLDIVKWACQINISRRMQCDNFVHVTVQQGETKSVAQPVTGPANINGTRLFRIVRIWNHLRWPRDSAIFAYTANTNNTGVGESAKLTKELHGWNSNTYQTPQFRQ